MVAPLYIGDEISAAGWRLAGVRVSVPEPGSETAALASALTLAPGAAPLVLVSAAVAVRIDAAALATAAGALSPLVLVLPDPQGEVSLPGLAGRLRTQLGLEA
jgi:vacuolar-type H+-ATPase subunit F/Vma7